MVVERPQPAAAEGILAKEPAPAYAWAALGKAPNRYTRHAIEAAQWGGRVERFGVGKFGNRDKKAERGRERRRGSLYYCTAKLLNKRARAQTF